MDNRITHFRICSCVWVIFLSFKRMRWKWAVCRVAPDGIASWKLAFAEYSCRIQKYLLVRMKGLNLILKTENWLGFPVLGTGRFLFGSSEMRRGWRHSVHGILWLFVGTWRVCCHPKISPGPRWEPALKKDHLLVENQGESSRWYRYFPQ